jgi:hypothetical protein
LPDQRSHRGAGPEDARLLAPDQLAQLRSAVADFSWLLTRGYAALSALNVVGDRYALTERQRAAVRRCACDDAALAGGTARRVGPEAVAGTILLIDGYNVLTTIETALGGGYVFIARDGCARDIAGVHGTYRKVEETVPALELAGGTLSDLGVAESVWYLDSPVSNSGRLRAIMLEVAGRNGWSKWRVEVVQNPDVILSQPTLDSTSLVATADSVILDRCGGWFALANEILLRHVPAARVIDLRSTLPDCDQSASSV